MNKSPRKQVWSRRRVEDSLQPYPIPSQESIEDENVSPGKEIYERNQTIEGLHMWNGTERGT